MAIDNLLGIGARAVTAGMQRMQGHAQDIASAGARVQRPADAAAPDLTTAVVGLTREKHLVQAATRIVASADEVLGSLLDEQA